MTPPLYGGMNTGERRRQLLFIPILVLCLFSFFFPIPAAAEEFDAILDEYLSGYWKANPAGAATPAGVHTYDQQLEDFSPAARNAEIQRNRAFLQRFRRLETTPLAPGKRVDLGIVLDHIQWTLLELEEIQFWKRNPQFYVSLLGDAVQALIKREFAPADRRFQAVAARLKLLPRALEQARGNLENPPELRTRKALDLIPGAADFLEKDVPQAASEQGASRKTQRRVAREAARAGATLRQFGKWLQADLLPRSRGNFVLGRELYSRKFRYYLGTALTPDQALAEAARDARLTQDEMRRLAAQIAPGRALPEVLGRLGREHPAPPDLLAAFRSAIAEARGFVQEKRLAPLPNPDRLRVAPAPAFSAPARAFLDPPGPFEPDLPSFYYVPVRDDFSVEAGEELLRDNNAYIIALVTAQETYPGRYVQREAMNQSPRLARKVFANQAFTEGWAHYSEQLIFEEGFRPDPRARLLQLANSLRSQLSAIVDIRLHTGQISPDDAVKLLMDEGFQGKAAAENAVERVSLNPAQLSTPYCGKLEILRLREEMRNKRGPAFSLQEFHEALLALGAPPVRSARALLLGEQ